MEEIKNIYLPESFLFNLYKLDRIPVPLSRNVLMSHTLKMLSGILLLAFPSVIAFVYPCVCSFFKLGF